MPLSELSRRKAEELIERCERREPAMEVLIGGNPVRLGLAAWEQGIHTPPLALATMLHRSVVMIHGTGDAWADADESRLLEGVLRDAGNDPVLQLADGAGHDLAEAPDSSIGAFAEAIAARIEARELPPVLVAIEGMSSDG